MFSSPELSIDTSYTVSTGGSSTGRLLDGLYTDGTYSGGTQLITFTQSYEVTTVNAGGAQIRTLHILKMNTGNPDKSVDKVKVI